MSVHWGGGLHFVKSVHANSSDQLEFASVGLLCLWGHTSRKGSLFFPLGTSKAPHMQALQRALKVTQYRSSAVQAAPRDDELFEIEGGTTPTAVSERVSDAIRKETEERYREWANSRDAADKVHIKIDEIRHSLDGSLKGPLMKDAVWREEVANYRAKYNAHRQASETSLRMSISLFERALTRQVQRPDDMTAERYRNMLVGNEPVKALAEAYSLSSAEVEATKQPPQDSYLEWTFLARVISRFAVARRDGVVACMHLLLDLMEALVNNTYPAEFPRSKIKATGSYSYSISVFNVDVTEMDALAEYVRTQTQQNSDSNAVYKVLRALELVWHFPIPDQDREWLRVDPRESIPEMLRSHVS